MGDAKLHKLLYYVQGYHLCWENQPAFDDDIEAWKLGPVVPSLWRAERTRRHIDQVDRPAESVCNVITYVLRQHEHRTGADLIHDTHAEAPWRDATADGRNIANQTISHESLVNWFSIESPELCLLRDAISKVRDDDAPFVPDSPELRQYLLAKAHQA